LPLLGSLNQANFPDVLSDEDEKKYLLLLEEKNIHARNTLIEHNLRLVAHIVKKFENTKVDKDDLLSIGSLGLIKAIDSYNIKNNVRLATYASRCIENEILMHLRYLKKSKDTISLYTPIGNDTEGNEIKLCDTIIDQNILTSEHILKDEYNIKLNNAVNTLSAQEQDILCKRYGLKNTKIETQKKIAKDLGISRSYVSRIEKRALTKLYLLLKDE
jgi:RNA polymerase sporulation-specific sigma factor